jgi:indole-3-glycerol phosphate synthase
MSGLLSEMRQSSLARVQAAKQRVSEAALCTIDPGAVVPTRVKLSDEGFDLIAEFKLRSPSCGDLASGTPDPTARLRAYAEGGASIVSILTEPTRFNGDLRDLRLAADTLRQYDVPVMRKDFLVDPYQVLEARAHGASGVLLILRMVPRQRLVEMLDCAAEYGLFVLLEAFDAQDLSLATELAAERAGREEQVFMGLNCRDLESLAIDFQRFSLLREKMPFQWPCVAESGVQSPGDALHVAALGYRLALVGTSLMQSDRPAQAVAELLAAARSGRAE